MEIINRFLKNGQLEKIPKKLSFKIEVFKEISKLFTVNKTYSEKEVNEILKKVFNDYAILRRYLVDFKFLERSKDCRVYTLNKTVENQK